ncbi:MAG: sulfatase [Pirellulaceae bacterium]|nr:sulfatase [Pirellulaceae bacterium]
MGHRKTFVVSVICLALAGPLVGADGPAQNETRPPNIVIIFIDDMGYADIGPFGATAYKTPYLDQMAQEGRLFTDFYVTSAVCSASRVGLLSGCYNARLGIYGALGPSSTTGIHPEETLLSEICRQQGYATACYGKWHLGHHAKFLPLQHGFDDYFGLPYSNDMWPLHPTAGDQFPDLPLIHKNRIVNPQVSADDQCQLTTQYTQHAVRFIESHKDEPFFVYLPHSMVHVPLYVSEKFSGKSGVGLFGDVMMELDWSVGQVLNTLRKHQLEENTLVIFTADNGPWLSYGDHAGSAAPLREGKGTMFDGGCREPTIFWWPGTVPGGTRCAEPVMTIDILPTIANLIGAPLPTRPIDGKNIGPLLKGTTGATSPHEALFFYWLRELQAIRMGKWKLHFPHRYRTLNGRRGGGQGIPVKYDQGAIETSLFDLSTDIAETTNLADQHPDIVQRMEALADEMRNELGDSRLKKVGSGIREPGKL